MRIRSPISVLLVSWLGAQPGLGCVGSASKAREGAQARPGPVASALAVPGVIRGPSGSALQSEGEPSRPSVTLPTPAPTAVEAREPSLSELGQAIAEHHFELAQALLARTSVQARALPLYALAQGVVALELGRADEALSHLSALEERLPAHDKLIENLRTQALALSTDYQEHLDTLYQVRNFAVALDLAERLLTDGQLKQSDRFVSRSYGLANTQLRRGQVRWVRARLRLAQGRAPAAVADLRWLAISNPDHPAAEAAFTLLSATPALPQLRVEDRYARANQLADAGLVEQTVESVRSITAQNPKRYRVADLTHLQGLALYRARQFAAAVPVLDQAVHLGTYKSDQDRYLAAQAASRAGDPKAAIDRFTAISRSTPITPNTQNALFRIGREWSLLGDWNAAVVAYTDFLNRFPKHEMADIAERERVIAWFAAGQYKRAAYWFRLLRQRDPDGSNATLLRDLEALSIARLGHPETARLIWKEVAQGSPLAFAGWVARARLRELGEQPVEPASVAPASSAMDFLLPIPAFELESLGLLANAAAALRRAEPVLTQAWAPRQDQALCQAHEQVSDGRRRFEIGYDAVQRRGFRNNPQGFEQWLWRCYFPTPYRQWVTRDAQAQHVSEALIYAVMRQESAFRARIVSPAGARGLMQIIEPTASKIAGELGHDYDPAHLDVPAHNIEYGTYYLSKLQAYFEHPALVAAAYNAGPDAAARWAAAGRRLPLEAFVLRIPYDETRNYVQRVLENAASYQGLYPEFSALALSLEFQASTAIAPAPQDMVHRAPDQFY